jgi:DNA modification methylase
MLTLIEELDLFGDPIIYKGKKNTDCTFIDNLSLPIHKWYRYTAGFSALWVREIIQKEKLKGRTNIIEPFAGSGTVLLESKFCNVKAIGIEAHPFVSRIAKAKLHWDVNLKDFQSYAFSILEQAKQCKSSETKYPSLIERCFSPSTLTCLDALRKTYYDNIDNSAISDLTFLAIITVLRKSLSAKTTQQYVFPNKFKEKKVDPFEIFKEQIFMMSKDLSILQKLTYSSSEDVILFQDDARNCNCIPDQWGDLVITSPPYANNYDYADATRLELSFLGEIEGWGDLQEKVRNYLVRSCTQHVSSLVKETYDIINDPILSIIKDEMTTVCQNLEAEKEHHGGKKNYHTMIASYFYDMAKVWIALRRVTKENSLVGFVIGDSAPYGIYVPVEKWLGELALAAGFKSYTFEKTRDRNIKWKNRKHKVPLQEGYLWVNG